jgi:hypothetical protein
VREFSDFFWKLQDDLLEQFRGKANIEVLNSALARQLIEVYEFYVQLGVMRELKNAEGAQLDGIGDIVVLSRFDALVLANSVGQQTEMDDDDYRNYLLWKIMLNTSNATHKDVYTAIKRFWDKSPLYYAEYPEHPATIFFSTPEMSTTDDLSALFIAPRIKAAGVAMRMTAVTKSAVKDARIGFAALANLNGFSVTTLPQYAFVEE